jgi:hypothetical protein
LSSTTDSARGQILPLFVLALTALLLAGALVLDGGMMLVSRRDQQNAADAAALAGAFYLTENTLSAQTAAYDAAEAMATENGFTAGDDVSVDIDPYSDPGYIEVAITTDRPSIFAGIMDVVGWDVGARAVALNDQGLNQGYTILALNPEVCNALDIEGNGAVEAYGDIQVNSAYDHVNAPGVPPCDGPPDQGAMDVGGGGTVTVTVEGGGTCNVVGTLSVRGSATLDGCSEPEDVGPIADPLAGLAAPERDALPLGEIKEVTTTGKLVPSGCPNAVDADGEATPDAATIASPNTCSFEGSYAGTEWKLYPGVYPGGLVLKRGKFYMEPGIYWIGGGAELEGSYKSLWVTGADLVTAKADTVEGVPNTDPCDVDDEGVPLLTDGCGVMIFNSYIDGTTNGIGLPGDVILEGGTADIDLHPIDDAPYAPIVYFQERAEDADGNALMTPQPVLRIAGNDSIMNVRGTIYSADGHVIVEGGDPPDGGPDAQLIMDQIIADTFRVAGADGSVIRALDQLTVDEQIEAAGLVE